MQALDAARWQAIIVAWRIPTKIYTAVDSDGNRVTTFFPIIHKSLLRMLLPRRLRPAIGEIIRFDIVTLEEAAILMRRFELYSLIMFFACCVAGAIIVRVALPLPPVAMIAQWAYVIAGTVQLLKCIAASRLRLDLEAAV